MKKNITFLCLVALSLCPITSLADDMVNVADKDGNSVSFLVSDHPTVTFDDENVIITTDAATVYYPLSAYRKFSIEASTGISSVVAKQPVFSFSEGMKAEGLQPGSAVTIYSVNGQMLAKGIADGQGMVSLSVDAPKGTVCIVKTAAASFKFIK